MTTDLTSGTLSRSISLFDTTLRDGEQAPGNTMSTTSKVVLAVTLEDLGVDVIEAGFPGSSPADSQATTAVAAALRTARHSTFNRTLRSDVDASLAAGGTGSRHQLQICGTGSDLHLEHKRRITRRQAVAEVADVVGYAVAHGALDVAFGVEDATRGEWDLMRSLVDTALTAGATTIVLADTTGCATPDEFGELCTAVRSWIGSGTELSTHCHDDLGMATANAFAGVLAGADVVQVTLGGIGERAGNTALEEIAALVAMKGPALGLDTGIALDGVNAAVRRLEAVLGAPVAPNKAVVGRNAFRTEAGIHQDGLLKNPATYEYLDPAMFGRERELVVGRHSGRAVIRHVLEQIGAPLDDGSVEQVYTTHVLGQESGMFAEVTALAKSLATRASARPAGCPGPLAAGPAAKEPVATGSVR